MDILTKLRVLLWLMVLSLWGTMIYQYLGDDHDVEGPQMQWVANPYRPPPARPSAPPVREEPPAEEGLAAVPPAAAELSTLAVAALPSEAAAPSIIPLPAPWDRDNQKLATAPPPGNFIKPLPPRLPAEPRPRQPIPKSLRRHEQNPVAEAATPKGFSFTPVRHFNVYSEGAPASDEFLETLEKLYANLMLDLAAFSPWAREEKVAIFLFRNQDSYRRVTGRPAWSGGASSVSKRKIYLYESDELLGILAHELCHIYFDGFFVGGKTNPLWLSEGLATLVQVERGLASPNWLPENLDILSRGGGFGFDDLMRVEDTSGANDDNVRLWYTQSYSVVRFLIRSQFKSSFYHFCRHLRDGRPIQEALYRSYGMPFNRVKALEYAWRYDVQTRRITGLRSAAQ